MVGGGVKIVPIETYSIAIVPYIQWCLALDGGLGDIVSDFGHFVPWGSLRPPWGKMYFSNPRLKDEVHRRVLKKHKFEIIKIPQNLMSDPKI